VDGPGRRRPKVDENYWLEGEGRGKEEEEEEEEEKKKKKRKKNTVDHAKKHS